MLPDLKPLSVAAVALSILLWAAPVHAIGSAEVALWAGQWNLGETPPDDDQVREVNTYDILTVDRVAPEGFGYVNAYNDVGYGPNEQTRMQGTAVFETASRAVDKEHQVAFTLRVGPEEGVKSITAVNTADAKAESLVFSQRAAYRAGFDCQKASTPPEHMICGSRVLARADLELGEIYKTVREKLGPPEQAQLTGAQRAWLKERDAQCVKVGKADGPCMGSAYANRLAALKKQADPALGRAPRFDAEYVMALARNSPDVCADTAFQAALYARALGAQVVKYKPKVTTSGDAAESRTAGTFSYGTIIYPADATVTVSFLIVVQASGDVWIATRDTSEPESQDYDGKAHVLTPRPKMPKASWPASIRNW